MNMQAVAGDLLDSMEVAEKVYGQEQKRDPLAWTVGTATEAIYEAWNRGEIDIEGVQEIVNDLKAEGGEIGKRVAKALQDYVDIEASNQGLCPKCFTKMVPGEVVSECVGECWGRPAYQDVLVTMECPACGHEEEL